MAGTTGRMAFNLTATLLAIPVGRAVQKAATSTWASLRPDNPPTDPKKVETKPHDALIFAGISGVSAALTSLVATKGADTVWRAVTGTPPPKEPAPKVKKKRGRKAEA
jgi:hypothetical protein